MRYEWCQKWCQHFIVQSSCVVLLIVREWEAPSQHAIPHISGVTRAWLLLLNGVYPKFVRRLLGPAMAITLASNSHPMLSMRERDSAVMQ